MIDTNTIAAWEYKNDFYSILIREAESRPRSYIFCCGINIRKFNNICWQRTGICSNPAFKGLQLLRVHVSQFARGHGLAIKNAGGRCDFGDGHGDGWYQEDPLLIDNAAPEDMEKLIAFSSHDLVRTVLAACRPDVRMPEGFMSPEDMQRFLESIGLRNE